MEPGDCNQPLIRLLCDEMGGMTAEMWKSIVQGKPKVTVVIQCPDDPMSVIYQASLGGTVIYSKCMRCHDG